MNESGCLRVQPAFLHDEHLCEAREGQECVWHGEVDAACTGDAHSRHRRRAIRAAILLPCAATAADTQHISWEKEEETGMLLED